MYKVCRLENLSWIIWNSYVCVCVCWGGFQSKLGLSARIPQRIRKLLSLFYPTSRKCIFNVFKDSTYMCNRTLWYFTEHTVPLIFSVTFLISIQSYPQSSKNRDFFLSLNKKYFSYSYLLNVNCVVKASAVVAPALASVLS